LQLDSQRFDSAWKGIDIGLRQFLVVSVLLCISFDSSRHLLGQTSGSWSFAISGDSRNCGDIIMPAIAQGVRRDGTQFYWHLGDFRSTYDFDMDILAAPKYRSTHLPIAEYQS
jgi:hypothetical protein